MIDSEYDVVVIGSGIAGLSAALAATERGFRVLVLEKAGLIGGVTANSYGLIWIGGNHLWLDQGGTDRIDDIVDYLYFLGGGELLEERMLALVNRSPEALRFYEGCGIPFRLVRGVSDHYFGVAPGATAEGRTLEVDLIAAHTLGSWADRVAMPADVPCYLTTEEQVAWGGLVRVASWDRALVSERQRLGLRGKGLGLVCHFLKALLERDVAVLTNAPVAELVLGDGGRVAGVRLATCELVEARHGVVIASGGYECSPELMRDFDALPGYEPHSPPSATGDGLIMGAEIGAAIRRIQNNMNLFLGISIAPDDPTAPPIRSQAGIVELCSPHTMVVNRRGQRFADESYFQGMVPELRRFDVARHEYANLPCYLIFDQQYASKYSLAQLPLGVIPKSVVRSTSLQTLGEQMGIDPAAFVESVRSFNGFAASGEDADFRRGSQHWRMAKGTSDSANSSLGTIEVPPFYAIELRPLLMTGSAGLLTDEWARVMHQRRHPIPGLYCTGVAATRTELGAGYQAGLNIASAMTFGYLAVEHMVGEREALTAYAS
jgi:3-oxosteroid 1-dehydrogenase